MKLRLGTRESKLAMLQTELVAAAIHEKFPEIELEIIKFKTTGDKFLQQRLETIGGKGLFVKEIEESMLADRLDFAIHSAKDVPSFLPEGLDLIGALPRAEARDVLISRYESIAALPEGAVVGTSSPRREAILHHLRPDLQFRLFRGNVITRLQQYDDGKYDAVILAKAGLDRLGITREDFHVLPIEQMLPASGQGTITIEGRVGDEKNRIIEAITCEKTFQTMLCERSFLQELNGGCGDPMAAYAEIQTDVLGIETITVTGMLMKDGKLVQDDMVGARAEYATLGAKLAKALRDGTSTATE